MTQWRRFYQDLLPVDQRHRLERLAILYKLTDSDSDAGFHEGRDSYHTIKLSRYMSEDEAHFTLAHEFAHAVVAIVHNKSGHGPEWKQVARLFKISSEPCHQFNLKAKKIIRQALDKLKET